MPYVSVDVSPVEQLARILFLGREWKKCFMAFVVNFDASGSPGQVAKVVVGYIARVQDWERFDCDWRLVLAHDNVPYFHMKEFAHFKGPYSDWKGQDSRRANFLSRLVGVTADHLRGRISAIVLHKDFSEVDQEYPLSEIMCNPYTLAARSNAGKVRQWMEENEYSKPVEYIFEDGDSDVDKGLLINRFKTDGFSSPIFKPKQDSDGRYYTPFQAADLAAYEFLKATTWADQSLLKSLAHLRKSLKLLTTIPAHDGTYEKDDLIKLGNYILHSIPLKTLDLQTFAFSSKIFASDAFCT